MTTLAMEQVNSINYEEFLTHFGGIVEHSSIVIAGLWSHAPFTDLADFHQKLCNILDRLPIEGIKIGIL